MGYIEVLPLTSRTPSIGVGYNSEFHAFLPWSISVIAYSHHMGYQLVLDKSMTFRWWYVKLPRHCTIGFEDVSESP